MTKRRFILLALLVGVLAFLAAGCGGDDNEAGRHGRHDRGRRRSNVSGNISVLAVWTGAEGEAFQAVLDGFTAENPDVKVAYKSATEPATVLSTSVEGGNPPDIAALPQPGFMTDFAQRGALKPIDFARGRDQGGFLAVVARPRHGRREALRPLLQGRQQVDHLVQRPRFQGRRRRARGELGRLPRDRRHDRGVRRPALLDRRRRRLDAHRPVREHLPPPGGPGEVRPADQARDSLDRSVGDRRADADGQAAPVRTRSPAAPRTRSRPTSRPR